MRAAARADPNLGRLVQQAHLEPAPLSKAARKKAEKRQRPIADVVRFRRSRTSSSTPSGEKANYSHRFFVIGNTAHYPPRTRTADADHGRHLTPCTRVRCQGMCRKVRRPSDIKGPDHLPLKP